MAFEDWKMPLAVPKRLRRGDCVMVVTPCWGGPEAFPNRFEAGVAYLEEHFGLRVIEAPHARKSAEWIYQNPKARADDLMLAFEDSEISGVIASIGGNDAIRVLPYLDLAIMARNPKVFVGYSDVTAIHFACLKAGIRTFYGPSIMSGFAENAGMCDAGRQSFTAAIFSTKPIGLLPKNTDGWTAQMLDWADKKVQSQPRNREPDAGLVVLQGAGKHVGHLIGGCAEVLETLKATPWWPDIDYWNKAVLFYETSEEAPSADNVERWMRNFAAQGILEKLSGILLSRPGGEATSPEYRQAQKDAVVAVLHEYGLRNLPVIADANIGHTDPIYTLPYGARVSLDCDNAEVAVLEAGVAD